jgi:hypothetical protein
MFGEKTGPFTIYEIGDGPTRSMESSDHGPAD